MAVAYKAPVKDIVFGYEVIDSYNILSKISAFSDFSEDIVVPTMEECAKFAEEVGGYRKVQNVMTVTPIKGW